MLRLALACTLVAVSALAAELRVEEKDLPRVPATEPVDAIKTLQVRPGFRAELMAAEPLIASPVAMDFDENGRLYIVEMRDYSEHRDERLGRVKLLEDTDGDGRFDKATVFADKLPWPTAIICWKGGVFVGSTPDLLYLKDANNDGVADERRVIFTGFGNAVAKLNVQQLLNSLTWGLDNRIHGMLGGNASVITNLAAKAPPLALRGRDFSFDPRTFDLRAESGGGQWGFGFDDAGRKFTCSNSRHVIAIMSDDHDATRNPYWSPPPAAADIAVDGPAAEIFRISPEEPWRVLRTKWRVAGLVSGPVEGGGRVSGYFSGATGLTVYRGDAFPPDFRGNVFVADCGANLIHRKILRPHGAGFVAERASDEQGSEFLAGRDNWFRPVTLANGPDGTLWCIDMYREVIEHPWSLPPELKRHLDLDSGRERGRIYRVVPDDFKPRRPPRLGKFNTPELAATLVHPNGWHRDTAARLLIERAEASAPVEVRKLLRATREPLARIHALSVLLGLDALMPEDVQLALADDDARVRVHALRCAKGGLDLQLLRLADDPDVRVRRQVALMTTNTDALRRIAARDADDPWMRAAVLGSSADVAAVLLAGFAPDGMFLQRTGAIELVRGLAGIIGASQRSNDIVTALGEIARSPAALPLAEALGTGLKRAHLSLGHPLLAPFARPLFDRARTVTTNAALAEAERTAAVHLLAATSFEASGTALDSLLRLNVAPALQMASIETLLSFHDGRGMTNIMGRWADLAPLTRTKTISLLLNRPADTAALLDEVENNIVSKNEFSATDRERLRTLREPVLRERAVQIFKRDVSPRAEVVNRFRAALDLKGNAARGHKSYQERCATCHRAGKEGFAVGADLAASASSGKEKLLTSILDPNAEVNVSFLAYTIETRDGESLFGIIGSEDARAVVLKVPGGESVSIPRSNIVSARSSERSLMPDGLEEGWTPQDLADLLEFIVKDAGRP